MRENLGEFKDCVRDFLIFSILLVIFFEGVRDFFEYFTPRV